MQPPISRVTFFDVGQGDAALIETQDGVQMLIDGGPDMFVLSELSQVMSPWDRSIDYVVATHPHGDHVVGLIEVLERYDVGVLLVSPSLHWSPSSEALMQVAEDRGVEVWTDYGRVAAQGVRVLFPFVSDEVDLHGDPNEASVVVEYFDGVHTFLFMGDVGFDVENQLLDAGRLRDVHVLKVGHHGSNYSTSRSFLKTVDPEWSVVSAGEENRYGHPHPATIKRLRDTGSRVLSTHEYGSVMFESFQDGLQVRLY